MNSVIQLQEAIANILSAKLRSLLAILGILVGTAAVVALMTSSELATSHALAQFNTLGTQLIAVNISHSSDKRNATEPELTLDKLYQLAHSIIEIEEIAPYAATFQEMVYRGQSFQGNVVGATRDFAHITKTQLAEGRFITAFDKTHPYGVIGAKLAKALKKHGMFNPLGQQLLVGDRFVTIVGVAKPWKPNLFVFLNMDEGLMVPIAAAQAQINNVLIKIMPNANLLQTQDLIKQKLQAILPSANINMHNPQQILALIKKQQATFTGLLVAIGSISLLVGGIGVMNIMLVSVVERRREIGIRLAIGAGQGDILRLFLLEAVVLTLFGGMLGILLGVLVSYLLAYFSGWEFYFFALPVVLGFVVSALVGIISGFYPALRASRLDPIASLRAE